MRKELLVFVPTIEAGEEISVASIKDDRNYVILSGASGKFTANLKELREALNSIEDFNKSNNPEKESVPENKYFQIEYGDK
jgi:hypothetical protein